MVRSIVFFLGASASFTFTNNPMSQAKDKTIGNEKNGQKVGKRENKKHDD